jgi:hypothetical protein
MTLNTTMEIIMNTQANNCLVLDTPEQINGYRMLTIRAGLRAESFGMKLTRGSSCLKLAKEASGLKARTAKQMLPLFEAWLESAGFVLTKR